MPRKTASRKSSTRSNAAARDTAFGRRLITAARQIRAHLRGELELPVRYYSVVPNVDIKQIREELGLSQSEFARRYGLNLRSLQEWEQGRRQPESAVRAYLIVIRQDPSAVAAALKATA
jgi:putative transcriptional regulator